MKKLKAASRLICAALTEVDGYELQRGANTFRCQSPLKAYEQASAFIKKLESSGFKFVKRAAMSDSMDVWRLKNLEISVGVHNGLLKLDLWD